jgi:hypothetical protein
MYRTGHVRKTMTLACALALTGVGACADAKDTALARLGRQTSRLGCGLSRPMLQICGQRLGGVSGSF